MKNLTYLFAAYAVIWSLLFLFLLNSARKLSHLAREIEALKKKIGGTSERQI